MFFCVCLISTGSPQRSFVFVLFRPCLYKVLLCLSFFNWLSTKFLVLRWRCQGRTWRRVCWRSRRSWSTEPPELSSWCLVFVSRTDCVSPCGAPCAPWSTLCISLWSTLGTLEHFVRLLVEHLVHLRAPCAPWSTLCIPLRSTLSERWSTLYLLKPCPAVITFCNRYSVIIYSKANIQTLRVIQQQHHINRGDLVFGIWNRVIFDTILSSYFNVQRTEKCSITMR